MAGKKTGKNPTDRVKSGTKRSLLTDGDGIPLAIVVDGANAHDNTLFEDTLVQVPDELRPDPEEFIQRLCADKAYDSDETRGIAEEYGYVPHIKSRGEEIENKKKSPRYRARRWVVERTHSWLNRFRRILVRWEKKPKNYMALLAIACSTIIMNKF